MNAHRDPDDLLAAWLEEGPDRLPDTARRAIVVDARTTRQSRRAWRAPWRSPTMNPVLRATIVIAVMVAAIGGIYLAIDRGPVVSGPGAVPTGTATPPVASASPSAAAPATPCVLDMLGASLLDDPACSYRTGQFDPGASVQGASGLSRTSENARHVQLQVVEPGGSAAGAGTITLITLRDVAADPCDPNWQNDPTLRTVPWTPPARGGGPAAFMDLLATTPLPMETPTQVRIGGYDGLLTTLRPKAGDLAACNGLVAFADILSSRAGIGEGVVMRLAAVDVNGTTILVEESADSTRFDAASGALDAVTRTVEFR